MEKTCLNCKYEPDWSEFGDGEYGTSKGDCKYPFNAQEIMDKIPACVLDTAKLNKFRIVRYKDNSGIHYNCGVHVKK